MDCRNIWRKVFSCHDGRSATHIVEAVSEQILISLRSTRVTSRGRCTGTVAGAVEEIATDFYFDPHHCRPAGTIQF